MSFIADALSKRNISSQYSLKFQFLDFNIMGFLFLNQDKRNGNSYSTFNFEVTWQFLQPRIWIPRPIFSIPSPSTDSPYRPTQITAAANTLFIISLSSTYSLCFVHSLPNTVSIFLSPPLSLSLKPVKSPRQPQGYF